MLSYFLVLRTFSLVNLRLAADDSTQAATSQPNFQCSKRAYSFCTYRCCFCQRLECSSRQDEDWVPSDQSANHQLCLLSFSLDILTTMIIPAPVGG